MQLNNEINNDKMSKYTMFAFLHNNNIITIIYNIISWVILGKCYFQNNLVTDYDITIIGMDAITHRNKFEKKASIVMYNIHKFYKFEKYSSNKIVTLKVS